jgi:epoxide hydrolase
MVMRLFIQQRWILSSFDHLSEDGAVTLLEPFRIEVPDAELVDLRRRLSAARWPTPETVSDWSHGLPLGVLRQLCEHWRTAYDWRATERRLNKLPHYQTATDGLSVHFIHVRSAAADAIPLIMTHGWPGSFFEFEQVIQRLADPAAFGEPPGPAFHVVVPSLPGYGFSDAPTKPGWNIHRIAAAWAELMERLGYSRFIALGSDWGTSISTCLALDHRPRVFGLHLIPPLVPPPATGETLTEPERTAIARLRSAPEQARPTPRCRQRGRRHLDTRWLTHRSDFVPGFWRRCGPGPTTKVIYGRFSVRIRCWTTSRCTG